MGSLPNTIPYIGYDGVKVDGSLRVEEFHLPIPTPADDQVLIHVTNSSINPLDWKLSVYNWFGRTDRVPLGFDISGKAVKIGKNVKHIKEGDEVIGYGTVVAHGVWASGGKGSYQVTFGDLVVPRQASVPAEVAGTLGVAWLSAYDAIKPNLKPNQKVYIPGGAGGVAHFTIQYAKTFPGVDVISSGSRTESVEIAKKSGARVVFNYKTGNVAAEVQKAFNSLADYVFDSTYQPSSFISSAQATAVNGTLVILGTLPESSETEFHNLVKEKNINLVVADLIRYFVDPEYVKKRNSGWLQDGFNTFQELFAKGRVTPVVTNRINGTLEEIRAELETSKNGRGLGKVAVRLVY